MARRAETCSFQRSHQNWPKVRLDRDNDGFTAGRRRPLINSTSDRPSSQNQILSWDFWTRFSVVAHCQLVEHPNKPRGRASLDCWITAVAEERQLCYVLASPKPGQYPQSSTSLHAPRAFLSSPKCPAFGCARTERRGRSQLRV